MTYRREFIAEIIEDKVARFVCEGLDEMTAAIQHIPAIARRRWRFIFKPRFSGLQIACSYTRR